MGFGNIKAERRAIEMTYLDSCKIERQITKQENSISKKVLEVIYEDVKCALSNAAPSANQTSSFNDIVYNAKLFLAPEIEIQAGDRITVTVCGRAFVFKNASAPALYPTHQEIYLREVDKN